MFLRVFVLSVAIAAILLSPHLKAGDSDSFFATGYVQAESDPQCSMIGVKLVDCQCDDCSGTGNECPIFGDITLLTQVGNYIGVNGYWVNTGLCPYIQVTDYTILTAPYLCGDANSDGEVNVSDAAYIISHVFVNGPAPDPYENGDANCDGDVNVSDAAFIISFIFANGNDPCDIDGDGQPDCDGTQ